MSIDFTAVRTGAELGTHVISACLFREPEWAERFPDRDFNTRYLEGSDRLAAFLAESGWGLVLFVDRAMLPIALSLAKLAERVEVYRVTTRPRFPFEQQVWRYLSVLLPGAEDRVWHFRGMDDLVPCATWRELAEGMVTGAADLLHWPCRQAAGRLYVPVRGKCSMRAAAVLSLRRWWQAHEAHDWTGDHWRNRWHSDELWLGEWFAAESDALRVTTVVDRWLGPEFQAWVKRREALGVGTRLTELT